MVKTKREEKVIEPEKPTEKDLEGFLAVLKRLGKPSTSREISDALGIKDADKGRALVRRVIAKLAEEGKVKITEAPEGTRAGKVYNLP
jgi:DNA-binding transcriptional regulator LsrR (DeoR family)